VAQTPRRRWLRTWPGGAAPAPSRAAAAATAMERMRGPRRRPPCSTILPTSRCRSHPHRP
jgi:hypothetical protein